MRPRFSWRLTAIAAVSALVLAACGDDGGGSGTASGGGGEEISVGAIYLDTQGFYAGVRKGIQDGAKEAGQPVKVVETNAQGDASKESNFINTLVNSQTKAIILSAVSAEGSVPAIRAASQAKIPVICYNTCVTPEAMDQYVYAYAFGDPVKFGADLGGAAADYFTKANITAPKIGVLNCEFVEVCKLRRQGFEQALKAKVPGYEIVANQEGTILDKAISVGENILTANPDLDAFFGESGGATLGAVKAVQNRKREGKTVVFGSDMTTEIAQALADHTILKAEVDVSGQAAGRIAVEQAIKAANGEPKPAEVNVPVPIDLYTTPEDAEKWLAEHPDGIP
jgi:simple sugar transport system substrate-binding protein